MTAPAVAAPVTHPLRPRRLPPRPRHPSHLRRHRRRRRARRPRRRPRRPRRPHRPRCRPPRRPRRPRRPPRRQLPRGLLLSVRAFARTAAAESCGPTLGAASIRWKSADRPARRPPTARASPTPRPPQTQQMPVVAKPPGTAAACCLQWRQPSAYSGRSRVGGSPRVRRSTTLLTVLILHLLHRRPLRPRSPCRPRTRPCHSRRPWPRRRP